MSRRLAGTCLTLIALAAAATPAAASVLYVGDSLGVGTSPYLEQSLGAELEADVETGRPSGAGVDVLEAAIEPGHDVVVFDLGTNDDPSAPDALAANLARARELTGDRCLVVATLNRPPVDGVPVDGLNRAVTSFAAREPAVALVDWHAAAAEDPGLLTDGVHSDPGGYELRARMFADAISGCAPVGAGSGAGGSGAPSASAQDLPPPASAGSNDRPAAQPAGGSRDSGAEAGLDPAMTALAGELARAIATGSEFG